MEPRNCFLYLTSNLDFQRPHVLLLFGSGFMHGKRLFLVIFRTKNLGLAYQIGIFFFWLLIYFIDFMCNSSFFCLCYIDVYADFKASGVVCPWNSFYFSAIFLAFCAQRWHLFLFYMILH